MTLEQLAVIVEEFKSAMAERFAELEKRVAAARESAQDAAADVADLKDSLEDAKVVIDEITIDTVEAHLELE